MTLDDARTVGNTSEPTVGRGWQVGGRQGHGGYQSSQCHIFGRRDTPMHYNTMEEASQIVDEMCLDTSYDIGSMAHDDAGPSYTFAYGNTSQSTSFITSLLPTTCTSPPSTTSTDPADVRGRDEIHAHP